MCEVSVVAADSNKLNVPMRKSTRGPEIEIVKRYIDFYKKLAVRRSWKHDVVIFVEPRLETGYPDLLIAHYDVKRTMRWTKMRENLIDRDLKILALLVNKGVMKKSLIAYTTGYCEHCVGDSLVSLQKCGLVLQIRGYWKAVNKTSFFSLERLIAVEAKTGNTSEALNQAFRNTGFSSLSYSLLGNASITNRLKNKYEALGVGAIDGNLFSELITPRKRKLPICYTSLMVNEWITKKVTMEATF